MPFELGLPDEAGRLVLGQDDLTVEADGPSISADDPLDEEFAGHDIQMVGLKGLEVTADDFRGRSDLLDGDVARFALFPEFLP